MSYTNIAGNIWILVLVLFISAPLFAQRTITVSGEGSAKIKPDHAIITFATVAEDVAAQGVYAKHDESDKKLRKAMTDAGVPNENIKERTYFLKPQYDQSSTLDSPPKTLGYNYFSIYELKTISLSSIPKIVDVAAATGAGNVVIESFNTSKLEEIQDRATKNAIANATVKASKIAQEIGAIIGSIISVALLEPVANTEVPREDGRGATMDKATANEVKATVTVSVVFSIQ